MGLFCMVALFGFAWANDTFHIAHMHFFHGLFVLYVIFWCNQVGSGSLVWTYSVVGKVFVTQQVFTS